MLTSTAVGSSAAYLEHKLDKAPSTTRPLCRSVVARRRTNWIFRGSRHLEGGRALLRALGQSAHASSNVHAERGAGNARKRATRARPLAGFWPPIIIHYIGRNPASKLRPESGRQIGAIFETILGKFGGRRWRNCLSISSPNGGRFANACK